MIRFIYNIQWSADISIQCQVQFQYLIIHWYLHQLFLLCSTSVVIYRLTTVRGCSGGLAWRGALEAHTPLTIDVYPSKK